MSTFLDQLESRYFEYVEGIFQDLKSVGFNFFCFEDFLLCNLKIFFFVCFPDCVALNSILAVIIVINVWCTKY